MSLSDAIRRLFSTRVPSGEEYIESERVQIVNVDQVPTHPIPAPTKATGKIDWLDILEIPYERWDMRVPQIKNEVYEMYISLADFIDKELLAYDTSLWELRTKLHQSYGHYNNILYTIYCIAEGEVTSCYKPSASYDNNFSYDLLKKHTNEGFGSRVKQFSKTYCEGLPRPDEETRTAYSLTPNGLDIVWWDKDGSLREKHKLSEMHISLLNKTPARTTNLLQVAEVSGHVLMQYMATLGVLKKEFESTPGWSKKMSAYLNSFFKDISFYRWDYGGDFRLLGYLLKLCEQTIRENVPYARLLKTEEEIAHIKRVLPKSIAEKTLQKATTLSWPITLSDDSIEALRKQNPHAWKTDIAELNKLDLHESLKTLNYYRNDEDFYQIAKEAIKQTADKPTVHLLAFYAYGMSLPADKEDFVNKRKLHQLITHSQQQKKFDELVDRKLPFDLNLVRGLELLTKPPVRTVNLDPGKLSAAHVEHEEALKKVSSYLGDDQIVEQSPVSEGSKSAINIYDLLDTVQDDVDLELTADQLEFLGMIIESSWSLPLSQAETFTKARHQLLRGFIQALNKDVYAHIEDQLITQDDDKITVDATYKSFVKEILNARDTA
jgi:hypothetical protein